MLGGGGNTDTSITHSRTVYVQAGRRVTCITYFYDLVGRRGVGAWVYGAVVGAGGGVDRKEGVQFDTGR